MYGRPQLIIDLLLLEFHVHYRYINLNRNNGKYRIAPREKINTILILLVVLFSLIFPLHHWHCVCLSSGSMI